MNHNHVPSSTSDKYVGKIIRNDLIPSDSPLVNDNNRCMILCKVLSINSFGESQLQIQSNHSTNTPGIQYCFIIWSGLPGQRWLARSCGPPYTTRFLLWRLVPCPVWAVQQMWAVVHPVRPLHEQAPIVQGCWLLGRHVVCSAQPYGGGVSWLPRMNWAEKVGNSCNYSKTVFQNVTEI